MLKPMVVATALLAGLVVFWSDGLRAQAPDTSRCFRGVFKHEGKIKSIQIFHENLTGKTEARVEASVQVEEGCFRYAAKGYLKRDRMILLPISVYLGEPAPTDADAKAVLDELGLKEFPTFDMASVVCHLDDKNERQIESVDIVLPDLTIYKVKRDHKTPKD